MKNNFYFILLLISLIGGCKKKEDLTEVTPEPGPSGMTEVRAFLKALDVTGATEVKFDTVFKCYFVSLPDNFNQRKAEVKLTLQPNIFLVDSLSENSTETVVQYAYQHTGALLVRLRDKSMKNETTFHVYFNFTGTPEAELLQNVLNVNSNGVKIPVRFKAKVGSVPATPLGGGVMVKFTNKKTGVVSEAEIYDFDYPISFINASNFVSPDLFSLEIRVYNQTPVVFENVKFLRDTPNINFYPGYQFDFAHGDTLRVFGGYFLPEMKYSITFSSDFAAVPVTEPMRVQDSTNIMLDKIPGTLAEGSYLLSVFEKDKLIGKSHIYVSGTTRKFIETIWRGGPDRATERNTERVVLAKGDAFYAKSLPLQYGYGQQTNFDKTKLPRLQFESTTGTVELEPEIVPYSWAIAGVSFPIGKYKIPSDLPSGQYTVSGIYADGVKTKPYWCRIEVR